MNRRRIAGALSVGLVIPMLAVVGPSASAQATPKAASQAGPASDTRELTNKSYTFEGKTQAEIEGSASRAQAKVEAQAQVLAAVETPAVGTVRQWLALDDFNQEYYLKDYTLRGVGDHIEVWVADDIAFPDGDCRSATPGTTEITDSQVARFVSEFDSNIYPKETTTFSTPPDRDGSNALIEGDYSGAGDKTVTLVDNVRDDNFYDFPAAPTYIAGFFSSAYNEYLDRNVMTIDAFDWLHRTGENPPNDPTDDVCSSRPGRPNLYEGTFAHEWQHLLQYYVDPNEVTWLNEGLSDFAQTLTGYVDATKTVYERGADSHIYCFQGFGTLQTDFNTNPRDCGGPENSLNLWDEGSDGNAVLADYGNAYSFMLYLYDHYGTKFMSALHSDGEFQGLASLQVELEKIGVKDVYKVLHDFQTSTLLDQIVGDSQRGKVIGVNKNRVTTASLRSTINFDNPLVNATPGAAPNGADYVLLSGESEDPYNPGSGPLAGKDLETIQFNGTPTLPTQPLAWTTVTDDPDRPGNPVIFSGNENSTDAYAVASVTVPTDDPTLTMLEKFGAEAGYDYGYVTVSTDGGKTYEPVAGDKTVEGPYGAAVNGTTDGFEPFSYDLSAYAGQEVLLGLRYVSDGGVNEGGWLLDDITLGGVLISDGSLDPFQSPTEIFPVAIYNWNLRLIGINSNSHKAAALVQEFKLNNNLTLSGDALKRLKAYETVVAIVSYDEPTEQVQQYAAYTLTVNGVLQAGGAPLS